MNDLSSKKCLPCEGEAAALDEAQSKTLLTQVPGWQLSQDFHQISRDFTFKNFYHTMAFVNAVAWIAHQENHHPDLEVGYQHCLVRYTTHAVNGLSHNDFICAAKVSKLIGEES